ncbi:SusF/SusE family outer membrane protein [Epilithonimonas zeae]|uniref:SusF/SusE family outer membrane protein n=1 Tax=Epilithonimonas zeae TaxID=1416779 RepID=UPI00200CDBD7|nr:SusE domain-containing protein [Epilithonimonas zeae]UQB70270.1 SusF/SusE family outer membrane protein [Epilithonimonas zeae]
MKNNIFKHFFLAAGLILGMISCEDREIINIETQSAPIVMDLSKNDLILDSNFPANPALTVTWKSAELTVPVQVVYQLEISATEGFENPKNLGPTVPSQYYSTFTTLEMNNAAKSIGFVPDVAQKMYVRVLSYVGPNKDLSQISNITSLNITPYLARPTYNYTDLYLIGNATAAGWDNLSTNANLLPMLKTSNSSVYEFVGLFKVGGFKMIKVKGSWDAQFGKGSADGQLSTDGGSSDIAVATEGYYKLSVNTADLTYSLTKIDSPVTTYDSVSLYGTATENTDVQLTKSTFDPHLWKSATAVSLKTGVVKFRANNAWDLNWGTNSEYFGVGTANGADIPVSAEWTYDVYFNDSTGHYTLIPTE